MIDFIVDGGNTFNSVVMHIKFSGKWCCHWQTDFGAQFHADVNVILHDVLGRRVMDSLASVPTTLGWNKKKSWNKKKKLAQQQCSAPTAVMYPFESTWVKSIRALCRSLKQCGKASF